MLSKYTAALLATFFLGTNALSIEKRWGLPTNKALYDTVNKGCLMDYADDGQLYSKGKTSWPNLFTLTHASWEAGSYVLTDTNTKHGSKLCVGSEGSGTANQFQCSNDPDNATGGDQAANTGEDFGISGEYLTYNGNLGFFGCGNMQTGINYYVVRLLLFLMRYY